MDIRAREEAKQKSIEVFCCYAHNDRSLLLELKTHLMPLEREGLITLWADIHINAGTDWQEEIHRHLNAAQIILLLISPDFIVSDYCYSIEMKRAMERHERGEARVIPIILRPAYWQGAPFGKLQALPAEAKPVVLWSHRDAALFTITQEIRAIVREEASEAIPIDDALLAALDIHKDLHRQKNVPFFTASLLFVLLEMPNSVAQRALETLRLGLAAEIQRKLKAFVTADPSSIPGSSFSDFQWEKRADVHLAQQWALKEGSTVVTERHMLLGILETKSNTQRGLEKMLGERDFCELLRIVKEDIQPVERPHTPDNIFQ